MPAPLTLTLSRVRERGLTFPGSSWLQLLVRQLDLHFEHVKIVLPLQVDLDVVGIDLDVFGNHRDQLFLQRGQVVGFGAASAALVRQYELQALLGNTGSLFLFAEQE